MAVRKLKEDILPTIFNSEAGSLVDCEFDAESVGQDQFMSNVVFVTAVLKVKSEQKNIKIPLVVKFEPFNQELRVFLNTSVQFYNEVIMYREVLPFLDKNNICDDTFAKFYYGVGKMEGNGLDNVVILEDLRPSGFKLTEERVFISYAHLTLAMAKLGRFHALSYAAKKKDFENFYKAVKNLKEPAWEEDHKFTAIVKSCFHRPMDYLINQGKHVEILQRLLKNFDHNIDRFMNMLKSPEEPLAVVCHGDFCRNNILFKYDSSGNPTDVKFFDVAMSKYSSPAVDISFFLLLNSSKETRKNHWDDLLATYHHSLSSTIPGVEVPSLEDIKEEMSRKAIYGFFHCAFFLPCMLYDTPFNNMEIVMKAPTDEIARDYTLIGGEEGTVLLADMVEELIERGCLSLNHEFMI